MSIIVNTSRGVSLNVGGVDYSSNLLSIELSDDSAVNNGIVTTSGTIVLGDTPGGGVIEDYDRDFFVRGQSVTINIVNELGSTVKHPRGHLYVVSTNYNIETNELSVDVGCKLYLASLSDEITNLLSYALFDIPSDRQTFSDLNSALQAECAFIWQNNNGQIIKQDFFDLDQAGTSKAPPNWTSVLGQTTLSAEALGSGLVPPDFLEVSYEYVVDAASDLDPDSLIDESTVTTKYTIDYPAVEYERIRPTTGLPGTTGPGDINETPPLGGRSSSTCGDSPAVPVDKDNEGDYEQCTQGYTSQEVVRLVDVEMTEVSRTYYSGPGRQVERTEKILYNAKIEHNEDYWKDYIEYCRFAYGTQCRPDGNCLTDALAQGREQMRDSIVIETNTYGEGDILVKKRVDTYTNMFDCYTPVDWRRRVIGLLNIFGNSLISEFIPMHAYTGRDYEYMSSRVETEYQYFDSHTIEKETTWTSDCGKESEFHQEGDSFIQRIKDAYPWGKKRVITKISSNKTPDREEQKSSDPTTVTKTGVVQDVRSKSSYVEPPDEAGPITMQTSVPFPIQGDISTVIYYANKYLSYYRRFLEGDNAGVRVVESLRADIIGGWFPSMPFRFYDPRHGKNLALRMNACSWGLTQTEAVVSTDGIYIGSSNGQISTAYNSSNILVPVTVNETAVNPIEGLTEVIQVNLLISVTRTNGNGDSETGIYALPDANNEVLVESTIVVYVNGGIYKPGSLLAAGQNNGVPIANGSTLVVTGAVAIDADLFSS